MFCPKCGSQNADDTKFCRGCGAELSNVLAVAPTTPAFGHPSSGRRGAAAGPDTRSLSEKRIELFSSGLRGVLIGAGFMFVAALAFALSTRSLAFSLFALAFAFFFLGTGISRLFHARALKALSTRDEPAALPPGQTDYINPSRSLYDTDDLIARPLSVTEHTTRHLKSDE